MRKGHSCLLYDNLLAGAPAAHGTGGPCEQDTAIPDEIKEVSPHLFWQASPHLYLHPLHVAYSVTKLMHAP